MFDIESLFIRQHPDFYAKHPRLSKLVIGTARWLWKEQEFRHFAAQHPGDSGIALIASGFAYIDFDFILSEADKARIPASGRLLIIANHPLGYLDGIGLLKIIGSIRPDIKLMLSDSLHVMLGMQDHTIPVDNFNGAISKQSLKAIHQHLDNEGALIIFPSGLVSGLTTRGIEDFAWNPSFLRFARQKNTPILPMYISGRNGILFYAAGLITRPLSKTVLLIRELLQMKLIREMFSRHPHTRLTMKTGELLTIEQLEQQHGSQSGMLQAVRDAVYAMKPGS